MNSSFFAYLIIGFLFVNGLQQKNKPVNDINIIATDNKYFLVESYNQEKLGAYNSADDAINYAIGLMDDGGSIELSSGKFNLRNTVYLKNGIALTGRGRRTELIIHATDRTGVGLFGKGLKDVEVSNLSLIAADKNDSTVLAGICYEDSGDCEIRNVYAEGFSKYGIWLRNNSFLCHIDNCTSADNGRANIFTDSLFWSRAGEYMPNLITNCITYGGYNGIETNKSIVLNIVGCIVHQPENFGFYINNVSNSVLLSGCRTYQTRNNAVVVENSHEINLTGNIFCWSRGKGIVLEGVSWGTISGNNIIDSGSERYGGFPGVGDAIGIELKNNTLGIQVTGNNIFNWGGQGIMKYAVYEDASCKNNSFTALNLNYFEEGGVVSKGENSLVENILYQKTPAYHGKPEGPDPLFVPERLQKFIKER